MADPLSVAASAIAVATVAAQITSTLSKLRILHELPGRLHALSNEVTDFEVVLRHVASVVAEPDSTFATDRGRALETTLQRGNTKLLQLNVIIQRLLRSCVSRGKFISRAKAWWTEQPRLLAVQEELRTIKANLNIMLGATHTQDIMRVHLDLQSVSLVTSELSEKQTDFQNEMTQTLQHFHSHVDCRIAAMEQIIQEQFSRLQSNLNADVDARCVPKPCPSRKLTISPTARIVENQWKAPPEIRGVSIGTIQYTSRVCQKQCRCACHATQQIRSLGQVAPVLGQLFVGYSGLPGSRHRCDVPRCKRHQTPFVSVEFWFPLWFLAWAIQLILAYQRGPQLQLRTLRRVPDSAKCIIFARCGNIEGIKDLLVQGLASIHDVSQTRNFTMLRWAVLMHQYETCKFLLEAGADPHQEGASDRVWDHVLRGGLSDSEQETVRALLDSSDYVEDQHFSSVHKIVLEMSFRPLEEELMSNPLAVFETDTNGRTALFWAAARGNERAIVTLLRCGAEPRAIDRTGYTPLTLAANQAHTGCIRLLLEAGAIPDPVSPKGVPTRSPALHNAVLHSNDPIAVKTLLDFGANVNSTSPDGETTLIIAARSRKTVHAKLLIDYGADLNARSKEGKTVLTTAIVYNNRGLVQMLLDQWYMYSACPRLDAPNLLGIVADYAEIETMNIIAKSEHLKLNPDSSFVLAASALDRVRKRADSSEELTLALREMLCVLGMPRAEETTKELLEEGLLKHDTASLSDSDDDVEIFEDALERRVVED